MQHNTTNTIGVLKKLVLPPRKHIITVSMITQLTMFDKIITPYPVTKMKRKKNKKMCPY